MTRETTLWGPQGLVPCLQKEHMQQLYAQSLLLPLLLMREKSSCSNSKISCCPAAQPMCSAWLTLKQQQQQLLLLLHPMAFLPRTSKEVLT